MGWIEFKTGRWIAHRAPGREFAGGIAACLVPNGIFLHAGTPSPGIHANATALRDLPVCRCTLGPPQIHPERRRMTKSRIAEWILAQVLPPDRAASTVGDWIEDVDKRGNIWFWSGVVRTATSAIRSDLTESPRLILALTLHSTVFSWLVFGVTYAVLASMTHQWWTARASASVTWNVWIGGLTGLWIARRAPGEEVAVCIATSLVPMMVGILIRLATLFLPRLRTDSSIILQSAVFGISLLTGALWLRYRQLHPVG
jgi:hypothetical protein